MMGYWKSKVAPKFKKLIPFELGSTKKKAAAAEALTAFDESKEAANKEFEEKKEELTPKVLEAYEAASPEVKTVVKERKEAGLKKNATAVNKFLDELAKIEFPGAKQASELSTKFGPALVSPAVFSVFEKVASLLPPEPEPEPAAETKEKEVVVEEVKKEEESSASAAAPPPGAEEVKAPVAEEPKKPESEPEPPKTEEPPKAAVEAPKPEEAPKKE